MQESAVELRYVAGDDQSRGEAVARMDAARSHTQYSATGGGRKELPVTDTTRTVAPKPSGSERKHNYAPGDRVKHKDDSIGTVTAYAPATQTAHVDWQSGPRSRVKGGRGTTKGYHVIRVEGGSKSVNTEGIRSTAGKVITARPGGKPRNEADPFGVFDDKVASEDRATRESHTRPAGVPSTAAPVRVGNKQLGWVAPDGALFDLKGNPRQLPGTTNAACSTSLSPNIWHARRRIRRMASPG